MPESHPVIGPSLTLLLQSFSVAYKFLKTHGCHSVRVGPLLVITEIMSGLNIMQSFDEEAPQDWSYSPEEKSHRRCCGRRSP